MAPWDGKKSLFWFLVCAFCSCLILLLLNGFGLNGFKLNSAIHVSFYKVVEVQTELIVTVTLALLAGIFKILGRF